MMVQVNHPGHDVLARGVNDPIPCGPVHVPTALRSDRVERNHVCDGIALNHDVVGAHRRPSVARNDVRIPDDESVIRSLR